MKKERIYSIDSLKGISCCVIAFIWHYLNMQYKTAGMPLYNILAPLYDNGQYFVELFFMISGFVIAYCYRNKIQNGEDFLPYIKKRFEHLYPLFFTTLMVMLIMQYFYYQVTATYYVYKVSAWHLILNILCIQSGWFNTEQSFNGPAWCISVEIFLYILYYITTKVTRNDKNAYTITNLAIFVTSMFFVYFKPCNLPILNLFMMRGISCFYAGTLICELNDRIPCEKKSLLSSMSLIGLVIGRVAMPFLGLNFWETQAKGQIGLILLQWPIILFAVINFKSMRKIMEIKPLVFLGKISMDIFLWHIPVQLLIKTVDAMLDLNINYSSVSVWLLYIALTFVVSIVSYYLFKKIRKHRYFIKFAVAIASCILVFWITDTTGIRMQPVLDNSLIYSDKASSVHLSNNATLIEEFYINKDTKLRKIQFYTVTWNKSFNDDQTLQVVIRNSETRKELYSETVKMSQFKDASIYTLTMQSPIDMSKNQWYTIEFVAKTSENQEYMAMMTTNNTNNIEGITYINGKESREHISVKIYTRS